MKQYELAVLLHPDLEIDLEAPLKRLDDTLKSVGATVSRRDEWGKRKLAYPIKDQAFAVYIFYLLEMAPDQVGKLEQTLRLSDEVLRHLIVTYEPPQEDETKEGKTTEDKEEQNGA